MNILLFRGCPRRAAGELPLRLQGRCADTCSPNIYRPDPAPASAYQLSNVTPPHSIPPIPPIKTRHQVCEWPDGRTFWGTWRRARWTNVSPSCTGVQSRIPAKTVIHKYKQHLAPGARLQHGRRRRLRGAECYVLLPLRAPRAWRSAAGRRPRTPGAWRSATARRPIARGTVIGRTLRLALGCKTVSASTSRMALGC